MASPGQPDHKKTISHNMGTILKRLILRDRTLASGGKKKEREGRAMEGKGVPRLRVTRILVPYGVIRMKKT